MTAPLPPGAMAAARRAFPAAAPHALKAALVAALPFVAAEFLAVADQAITDHAGEVIGLAVAAERERCADLLEAAWGVIANAGWDDCAKSPGWQEAAERWRDRYHAHLPGLLRQEAAGEL